MTWVKESLKLIFKSRIRSRYTIGVINDRFPIGKHASDRESHRDAMISVTLYVAGNQWSSPINFQTIFGFDHIDPHEFREP